jgi:hypothetical protein
MQQAGAAQHPSVSACETAATEAAQHPPPVTTFMKQQHTGIAAAKSRAVNRWVRPRRRRVISNSLYIWLAMWTSDHLALVCQRWLTARQGLFFSATKPFCTNHDRSKAMRIVFCSLVGVDPVTFSAFHLTGACGGAW